jgi:hypothetical protein
MAVSAEHEADMTRGLEPAQRSALVDLLNRVALDQGLIKGVHPGLADPKADQTRDVADD